MMIYIYIYIYIKGRELYIDEFLKYTIDIGLYDKYLSFEHFRFLFLTDQTGQH